MLRPSLLLALFIALPLSVSSSGCKKKEADPPKDGGAPVADGDKEHFRFRPKEGSSTVLGKARDRALDAEVINEMRQIPTMIMADNPVSPASPGDERGWQALLRDCRTLRGLQAKGELVYFNNVRLNTPNTVLMYEKRVVDEDDGIVLTADGRAERMNKAQLDKLTKPR